MNQKSLPDGQEIDTARADIGIVCALNLEVAPLLNRCEWVRKYTGGDFVFRGGRYNDVKIAIVEAGMGRNRAERATRALIEAHSPAWILSCGFSGGLTPEMRIGDIVAANSIVGPTGQLSEGISVDLRMPADPANGLHVGRIVTVPKILRTIDEKRELAALTGGIAVDMESLAVAEVCRQTQTRFLAIRVISDDLSADLPPEVLTVMGSTGSVRFGAALGSLWKRPGSIKDMWRLRESAHRAAERLASFLDGVLTQLHATSK